MSVINKMLRDLDQRQTPSNRPASDGARRNTVSVETDTLPRRAAPAGRSGWWLALVIVVLASAAGGAYWWLRMGSPALLGSDTPLTLHLKDDDVLNLPVAQPAVISPVAPAATPDVATLAPDTASAAVPLAAAPSATTESGPATASLPAPVGVSASSPAATKPAVQSTTSAAVAARVQPAVTAPANVPTPIPTIPAIKPAAPQPVANSATGATAPPVNPAQRQQQAARDALAQAQTLWNTGAQDTAISSLQAAVEVAQRQDSAGMLAPLVRELARMELAQGRPAAVLELLTRLEPQLTNQADLWAVRANAAQRLGRHQDSVMAYGMALQSRPTESRWLLGMAVSLAAMGQTSQAAAMVEKARASGPISPDVALYLRQQGVPLSDTK